jgi:hypothetical protein
MRRVLLTWYSSRHSLTSRWKGRDDSLDGRALVGDCRPVEAAVVVVVEEEEVEKEDTSTLSRMVAISLSRSCTM